MLLTWLLVGVAAVRATPTPGAEHAPTPPTEHVPSSSVQDNHKYYKLSVYQNNALKAFDENFIDMEAAEIKAGEIEFHALEYYGASLTQIPANHDNALCFYLSI